MQKPVLFLQSSVRSLLTFSCSRHKTSQYYAELTDRPARTNSQLLTIPLMSKKTISMLLTLLSTCFAFFDLYTAIQMAAVPFYSRHLRLFRRKLLCNHLRTETDSVSETLYFVVSYNTGRLTKSKIPTILSVMHHFDNR
jgi:hypothetical protein